jgi:adenylate cyclase
LVAAYTILHLAHFWLGNFVASRRYSERALALYEPGQHGAHIVTYSLDNGLAGRAFHALGAWVFGYPEQARETMAATLAAARAHAHPLTLIFALASATLLGIVGREAESAEALAEEAVQFAGQHEQWLYLAFATGYRGWVWSAQGRYEDGIAALRESMTSYQKLGSRHAHSWACAWLAEAYLKVGRASDAAALIDEVLAFVGPDGQHFWDAELYRLRGQARLATDAAAAERDYLRAIDTARTQEGKSLELRAATSLARLWQGQGKREEARALLAPVYGWFTEGFDTRDLREAKALLDELT